MTFADNLFHSSSCLPGGLFFSLSMCLIICILSGRCKNKVTNMTDPHGPVHRSSENGAEPNHHLKGRPVNHKLVGSLQQYHKTMKASEIESMMFAVPPPHSDKGRDLDRFLHSEMRATKSEPLVFSIGVRAPVLCGEIVRCQTAVKVCNTTELYQQDPRSATSPGHEVNIQNIEAAGLHIEGPSNRRRSCHSDNETGVYGNPSDKITDLVTYFEAYMDSENVTRTEGNDPSPQYGASCSDGNPLIFGKKCKTWSTFLEHVQQDKSTVDPSKRLDVPKSDEELRARGEELVGGICDRERLDETSLTDGEDNHREEHRTSPGIDHMDIRHGLPHTDITGDQPGSDNHLSESRAEEGPCRPPHQGPPKKTKTSKPSEKSSMAHEKFWKYHKNCCDEFEPCQAASKVLRQLRTQEQGPRTTEEARQEPPPDEELLEEKTSLPLLLSKPSENLMSTNPVISSKKPCVSLPNLGAYSDQYLIIANSPVVVQDETGKENNSENTLVCDTDIDLPEDIVGKERMMDVSPCTIDLPIIHVPTGGTLYDESGILGPSSDIAPGNSSEQDSGPSKLGLQVLIAPDLECDRHNLQVLPDIGAPYGRKVREDETSQVEPSVILSSTPLHLPTIDVSSGDNITGRNPLQNNLPINLDAMMLKGQTQSVRGDEKFSDVSPSLPDVLHKGLLHKVDLPNMAAYSEASMINDPNDILHWNQSLPPKDKTLEESKPVKPEKQRSNQGVKAKSCPALSAMLDNDNRNRNPKYKRGKSKPDKKIKTVIDPRNTVITQSHAKKCETSKEVPAKPVEAIHSQKSLPPDKERELSPAGAETQLTSSGSYSISSQDGDDISEWPKTSDILKQSSTISLSSKYDIMESSTLPSSKEDSDHSAVLDDGHNVVTSDFSTCGTETFHVLPLCALEDGNDQKASSREESMATAEGEYTRENTLCRYSTLEEVSERQVLDIKTRDAAMDRANLMQTCHLDELSHNDSEDCRKESSDTTTSHDRSQGDCVQFSLVNEQRPDPEDPSVDLNSLNLKFQTSHLQVARSKDNCMENQENIGVSGSDQAIHNVSLEDSWTPFYTGNLDRSCVGHGDINPSDDTLTSNREKVKNHHRDDGFVGDENGMKEISNDQSNLCSNLPRSKDVTSKFRRKTGTTKLEANKPFKTDDIMTPCLRDLRQELKDYISSRLSRRPFQSVFPISIKTSCPEDGNKSNPSYLEDPPFDSSTIFTNPSRMLADTQSQPNVTSNNPEEISRKSAMTEATEYLTYLYARGPKLKISPYPPGISDMEDKTKDDIRVLANLQFCKVSGGVIGDSEAPETVQEVAEGHKSVSSEPENIYIPPSKRELRADDELAVLHVMCTLKKSLEISAMSDTDNRTDE